MAETCARRGLTLNQPVTVRSMTAFAGGYTPGVGSVTWEPEYAETWRGGWCALGVYCHKTGGKTGNGGGAAQSSALKGPAGLYDVERNTLFVRDVEGSPPVATVAHETTHALQYQNFPALHAVHPWYNRDLAAAVGSAVEGDAHVVGWSFDRDYRLRLCSLDPNRATQSDIQWWGWTPQVYWAHEGFPHVFGAQLALRRRLAAGQAGVDELLREPPLSTLAVLKPERADGVVFIDLPKLVDERLAARGCRQGLVNTAGALGIWGLLLQHGGAGVDAVELPAFIEDWRGDRFAHIVCPDDNDDELAWLTRWRTAAAAQEFAERYGAIASAATAHGGVLGGAATAHVHDRSVVVVTAGLSDHVRALRAARSETFANIAQWRARGCFPERECHVPPPSAVASGDHVCAAAATPPAAFDDWLARIRRAREAWRDGSVRESKEALSSALEAAGDLAAFCVVNAAGADPMLACRTVYQGAANLAWLHDTDWPLLPYCASAEEVRAWVRTTYHADAEMPFATEQTFRSIHGLALAAAAFQDGGVDGLRALIANPPLSTRAIMQPDAGERVTFLQLPADELAGLGCRIIASDVHGALGIWNLFLDYAGLPPADTPPEFLFAWRGDLQAYLRCANGEGWIWLTRWADADAANTFAAHYGSLSPDVSETGLPTVAAEVSGATVLVMPPGLEALRTLLRQGYAERSYANYAEWVADGCFPREACAVGRP